MRTMLRGKVTLLFMMLGMLLAIPAIALADDVTNNLDGSVDTTLESMNLTVGGPNGTTTIYVEPTGTGNTPADGKSGCNLTGSTTLTVSAASNDTDVATVSPSSTTLTGCGVANGKSITVTPVATGTATITVSGPGSITVGSETRTFDYKANFTVNVAAAPVTNHNPTVVGAGAANANGNEGDTLTTNGAFADQDANDTLTITKDSGAGTVTPGANSTWSWSLPTTDNGSGTVVVKADDGHGGTVTDTFDWSAANVAPTATKAFESPVDEGSPFNLALTDPSDPSSADTTAGFQYAFDCDLDDGAADYQAGFSSTSSTSCSTNDNGNRSVGAKIKDKDDGVTEYTGTVTVNNVAPTITNISASVQNVLSGNNVSFTGTATDPSSVDTTAGFSWQWSKDGGAYTAGSNPFSTSFSTCSSHSVSAKATDKDGGTSAAVSSGNVNVYDGSFLAPLKAASDNLVQKGRVLPVKISVGCGTNLLTGLTPDIRLFSGDPTAAVNEADFVVPAESVSSADTTGVMRPVDGGYIYNLQVPNDSKATVGAKYYIRVSPFGINAGQHMLISIQIRK